MSIYKPKELKIHSSLPMLLEEAVRPIVDAYLDVEIDLLVINHSAAHLRAEWGASGMICNTPYIGKCGLWYCIHPYVFNLNTFKLDQKVYGKNPVSSQTNCSLSIAVHFARK